MYFCHIRESFHLLGKLILNKYIYLNKVLFLACLSGMYSLNPDQPQSMDQYHWTTDIKHSDQAGETEPKIWGPNTLVMINIYM